MYILRYDGRKNGIQLLDCTSWLIPARSTVGTSGFRHYRALSQIKDHERFCVTPGLLNYPNAPTPPLPKKASCLVEALLPNLDYTGSHDQLILSSTPGTFQTSGSFLALHAQVARQRCEARWWWRGIRTLCVLCIPKRCIASDVSRCGCLIFDIVCHRRGASEIFDR